MSRKRVVIIGGGFAGIKAAKALGNKDELEVILLDRRNYHLFQPLLYQVATAGLSPAEISGPIRSILSRYKNVYVFLDKAKQINLDRKTVTVQDRELPYDYLIMACGAQHSYFAHPEWEEDAPGLKTLEQATEIRRRILMAFEMAEKEEDPEKQKQHLTFVIVGAGPTGVELAGTIAEISRNTLTKDFRRIDPANTRVMLIEAGPRILAAFDPTLSRKAARDLEDLGVQIWTSTRVTDIKDDHVTLGNEMLRASTILWAAGVKPSSLNQTLGVPLDKVGRVIIEKDLSIKDHPETFVLGDQACFLDDNGVPLPGLASVAMQQGSWAADNILREISGKPRKDFKYLDKGQMATIGRRKAIAQVGKLKFSGLLAWLIWLFIHVYYLIGFKNKIFVIWQWAYAYFTFKRGARLISEKDWRSQSTPPSQPTQVS
ncbi:NADH dehydrogenase-like protein [compost metagenome]